jgi:hypothetical protein
MGETGFRVIGSDRCENLRWKGMFIDLEQGAPAGGDHILWCLKTQLALGPDGKLVDKYECNAARACYKAL